MAFGDADYWQAMVDVASSKKDPKRTIVSVGMAVRVDGGKHQGRAGTVKRVMMSRYTSTRYWPPAMYDLAIMTKRTGHVALVEFSDGSSGWVDCDKHLVDVAVEQGWVEGTK